MPELGLRPGQLMSTAESQPAGREKPRSFRVTEAFGGGAGSEQSAGGHCSLGPSLQAVTRLAELSVSGRELCLPPLKGHWHPGWDSCGIWGARGRGACTGQPPKPRRILSPVFTVPGSSDLGPQQESRGDPSVTDPAAEFTASLGAFADGSRGSPPPPLPGPSTGRLCVQLILVLCPLRATESHHVRACLVTTAAAPRPPAPTPGGLCGVFQTGPFLPATENVR